MQLAGSLFGWAEDSDPLVIQKARGNLELVTRGEPGTFGSHNDPTPYPTKAGKRKTGPEREVMLSSVSLKFKIFSASTYLASPMCPTPFWGWVSGGKQKRHKVLPSRALHSRDG